MEVWVVCILKFLLISGVGCDNWRIFGGLRVKPGEYPHIVFVIANRVSIRYCTGSILSPDWILTAAHCLQVEGLDIPAHKIRVFAGISNYKESPPEDTVQSSNGLRLVVHPDYQLFNVSNFTDLSSYNDLGLLQLEQPFLFNSFVSDIALSAMIPADDNMIGCSAAGFGQTEDGHTMRLNVIEVLKVTSCTNIGDRDLSVLYDNDDYLCGYAGKGKFPSNGDSGSPLECGRKVVGVCFWVKTMSEHNDRIMLHTAVHRFIPWILSYVGDLIVTD